MRRLLFLLVLVLGFFFIIQQFTEIQTILETVQKGDSHFLLLAFIVQIIWLFNVAAAYRVIYRAIGVEESIWRFLLMSTAATATNIVAPSAGVGGIAVFVSEAKRRKNSIARVTVANLIYLLLDYVGFLFVLMIGLAIYLQKNPFHPALVVGTSVLVILTGSLGAFIFLCLKSPHRSGKLLIGITRSANHFLRFFFRRDFFSEERAWALAQDTSEGLQQIRQNPPSIWMTLILALNNRILLMVVLGLVFLAFQIPVSIGTVIAGFSIGYLFFIVSPTPAGVGFVEGALTLVLTAYQVPLSAATVVTLVYRGITFWFPLLVGLLAMQILGGKLGLKVRKMPRPKRELQNLPYHRAEQPLPKVLDKYS
jgi:uncharacterized protein (TIRG00374 family)